MAEKEERIFISKTDSPDGFRDENATVRGYTVQEALERMAKALYEHQYQKMRPLWEDEDNGYVEIYLKRAEAALNALLVK